MSILGLALKRPCTFTVMAMLIVLATPFARLNMIRGRPRPPSPAPRSAGFARRP
jgi:hypothetical protein